MIQDDVFRIEYDGYLKKLGYSKLDRNKTIEIGLHRPIDQRDKILDDAKSLVMAEAFKDFVPIESAEQIEVVRWFNELYPFHLIICARNDAARNLYEGVKQKRMGVVPGVSDLHIPWLGLWVEMKRKKGGVWSDEQQKFAEYINSLPGNQYVLCDGADKAKEEILDRVDFFTKH